MQAGNPSIRPCTLSNWWRSVREHRESYEANTPVEIEETDTLEVRACVPASVGTRLITGGRSLGEMHHNSGLYDHTGCI